MGGTPLIKSTAYVIFWYVWNRKSGVSLLQYPKKYQSFLKSWVEGKKTSNAVNFNFWCLPSEHKFGHVGTVQCPCGHIFLCPKFVTHCQREGSRPDRFCPCRGPVKCSVRCWNPVRKETKVAPLRYLCRKGASIFWLWTTALHFGYWIGVI